MFVYPNHLKNVTASSSCGAKSKQLDTIPPAHISVHVGWRIQSTTIESSLSKVMTLSLPLQSWRWSQRWTSWRRHVSSTTKLEDITMLRSTPWSPINSISIVFDCVVWWNSVFAWWCLFLWPCLIRSFVMIVGVLWVFYLQWHQLPRWVLLFIPPPPCYPPSFYLILSRMSRRKFMVTLTAILATSKHLQWSTNERS